MTGLGRYALLLFLVCAFGVRPCMAQSSDAQRTADWRATGAPLVFDGILYYPAGPRVFFTPNVMARVGTFEGVTLYQDTTLEPNSIIFVPIGGKLMQPYERRRSGELAGTEGSRTPSFPIEASGGFERTEPLEEEIEPATSTPLIPFPATSNLQPPAPALTEVPHINRCVESATVHTRVPVTGGIWIEFDNKAWVLSTEPPIPTSLDTVGEMNGFPVFGDRARPGEIFVPSARGGPLVRYVLTPWAAALRRTLPFSCGDRAR